MASSRVRSHLWVFHSTARCLHPRTATLLETVGFLQLLYKRVREDGDGVGPQKQQLVQGVESIRQSQPKCSG